MNLPNCSVFEDVINEVIRPIFFFFFNEFNNMKNVFMYIVIPHVY